MVDAVPVVYFLCGSEVVLHPGPVPALHSLQGPQVRRRHRKGVLKQQVHIDNVYLLQPFSYKHRSFFSEELSNITIKDFRPVFMCFTLRIPSWILKRG